MDSTHQAEPNELLSQHREALHARGLTDEQIAARGYRSVTDTKDGRKLLTDAAIVKSGQRFPGLLLPLRRADGSVWSYQYRPDNPRIGNDGRLIKYESAHRMKVGLDVPPGVILTRLTDPSEPLLITEGVFKADAGAVAGLKIVALIGVWNWIYTNDAGGKAVIPELYELAVNGGRVVLAFDGDVCRKFSVQHAAKTLGGWLESRGATVEYLHLPDGADKVGLDDFLAAGHTAADVMRLVHPHLPALQEESGHQAKHSEPSRPKPEFGSIDGAAVLYDIALWLERFIRFTHDDDVFLLTLWIAASHMAVELYTSPRLRIDSISYGSGKTTLLEHLERLCRGALLIATLPSVALIPRLVDSRRTTLLFDEIDRTLDPKNPGTAEILAIVNSGYRFGAKRPVLVQDSTGNWVSEEMSTFAPVGMAGNLPHLPADTRSREIRVVLMPDLDGVIEDTQWWVHEAEAAQLAENLAGWAESVREQIAAIPVEKPVDCRGRMWEKFRPILLVATAAGDRWPEIAIRLIEQNVGEEEAMRDADMDSRPRAVVLLDDLYALWPTEERFMNTEELLSSLKEFNKAYWSKDGDSNPYGKDLTAKGLRSMIANAAKLTPRPEAYDVAPIQPSRGARRGYFRQAFVPLWRRLNISERVDETAPVRPDESDAHSASGAEGQETAPDSPTASDSSGIYGGTESTHSLTEWCLDCGTELTAENMTSGSYCLECLDARESGEEPSDD